MDLTNLNSNVVDEIIIDQEYQINQDYLDTSEIITIKNLLVKGKIYKNVALETNLDLSVTGIMILEDSISLEPVEYPFNFKLDEEFIENNQNTLDIMEILWENIVLEIPLRFTKINDLSEFQGNGWKLLSEDDLKDENNPFKDLQNKLGEE